MVPDNAIKIIILINKKVLIKIIIQQALEKETTKNIVRSWGVCTRTHTYPNN